MFGNTLTELARIDPKIVAITAAMLDGTGLNIFQKAFPERCFDVGIAEQHAVTFAAGLAAQGMRPVAAIYSTFLQRGFDQVLHDVCLQNLPVTFAMDRGGLVGADGPTHHGLYDMAYLRCMPNLILMAPKDENELRQMLLTALYSNRPAALRYPRGAGRGVPLQEPVAALPIGKGELLREGDQLALVAIGTMVAPALAAGRAAGGRRDRLRRHQRPLHQAPGPGTDRPLGAPDAQGGGPRGGLRPGRVHLRRGRAPGGREYPQAPAALRRPRPPGPARRPARLLDEQGLSVAALRRRVLAFAAE